MNTKSGSSGAVDRAPEVRHEPGAVEVVTEKDDHAEKIDRARRGLASCAAKALEYYREMGDSLITVKARLGHGDFVRWVESRCGFGYRSAAQYMEIARRWDELERLRRANVNPDALFGLGRALRMLSGTRPETGGVVEPPASARGVVEPGDAVALEPRSVNDAQEIRQDLARVEPASARNQSVWSGPAARIGSDEDQVEGTPAREMLAHAGMNGDCPAGMTAHADPEVSGEASRSPVGVADGPGAGVSAGEDPGTPVPGAGARGWSRDRIVDTVWLTGMGGIRPRLRASGNTGDFDRDATAWRQLRPVAEAFALRRPRLWGDAGPRPS